MSVPTSTRRRDWFMILRDLAKAGVSYAYVARKCGRNPCTVGEWADGGDPKERDARIILALYAKHCPVEYTEHQKAFAIRVEMANVTGTGETFGLPFVGE